MLTKEEHIIELTMRFAIVMRSPSLVASNGRMLSVNPTHGQTAEDRLLDQEIARFAAATAKVYIDEAYRIAFPEAAAAAEKSSQQIEAPGPDDDLEKTRIRF